jgi:hypothetical protein
MDHEALVAGATVAAGIALGSGKWSAAATNDDLTWVFLNGIGNLTYGGSV